MMKIERTVFISYRRTNSFMARAIYADLVVHGYDVFIDFESLDSGDFSQNILQSIESRAHFLLILTPTALERCNEPNDMLMREIEHALKRKRNIITLTFEGFKFTDMEKYLPKHVYEPLSLYNAVRVPADYFDAAMEKLRRYLNVPLEMVLHPKSTMTMKLETYQQEAVQRTPNVTENELFAEELLEQATEAANIENYKRARELASSAIQKKKDLALAYSLRASASSKLRDFDQALIDADHAMYLSPEDPRVIMHRGNVYFFMKNYVAAIKSYSHAIELDENFAQAYLSRGSAYSKVGNLEAALQDYTKAIELNPSYNAAYYNRALVHRSKNNWQAAIDDYTQAIRLNSSNSLAYFQRGLAHNTLGNYHDAIVDFSLAIHLSADNARFYDNRGIAFLELGNYEMAIVDFEQALDINPDYNMAKHNLAKARRKRAMK